MSDTWLVLVFVVLFVVGYRLVALWLRHPPGDTAASALASASALEPSWFRVLEVAPDADVDAIRAAYRRLIGQYHPDKVATLGSELQALAAAKSAAINEAYRVGLQARGGGR